MRPRQRERTRDISSWRANDLAKTAERGRADPPRGLILVVVVEVVL